MCVCERERGGGGKEGKRGGETEACMRFHQCQLKLRYYTDHYKLQRYLAGEEVRKGSMR